MKKITSAQNPRLRNAIRLKTSRGRKIQRRVIVFGLREVRRAIASGIHPLEIFLSSEVVPRDVLDSLQNESPQSTEFYDLPAKLMERLKYGERMDGVVAIAQRPELSLDKLELGDNPMIVILEAAEKPGNIGAVLRSIDGSGANALILADPQCDVLHPNCIRASMGSAFSVPIAIATVDKVIQWCRRNSITIYAAMDSASENYANINFRGPVAIALGNECNGLSTQWQADDITGISIPMEGVSDSLNISVAAGVILFEGRRQRYGPSGSKS